MQSKHMLATLLAATLLSGIGLALAADKEQAAKPSAGMPGMEGMHMDHGMMGGDMKGMMDMMGTCHRMMGGGMMGGAMMPQLPPGNEKLQLQMQAEMMQKIGEITAKYAAKIKDEKTAR